MPEWHLEAEKAPRFVHWLLKAHLSYLRLNRNMAVPSKNIFSSTYVVKFVFAFLYFRRDCFQLKGWIMGMVVFSFF